MWIKIIKILIITQSDQNNELQTYFINFDHKLFDSYHNTHNHHKSYNNILTHLCTIKKSVVMYHHLNNEAIQINKKLAATTTSR